MNSDALKAKVIDAAKTLNISFNETFHRLVMERFLVRLALSSHNQHLIFKGGFLLSHYVNLGRETRDLDFLLTKIKAEKSTIKRTLSEIGAINTGDGFVFTLAEISDLPHEHMKYAGFRIKFKVLFEKLRESLEIDIGVGDVVNAQSEALKLMTGKGKPIFEDEVSLLVYPTETIVAEKLQTLVSRAEQNSRMKDYYDILTILRAKKFDSHKLKNTILATFEHRGTKISLLPICFSSDEITALQKYWTAFLRVLRKKEDVPLNIKEVVDAINSTLVF